MSICCGCGNELDCIEDQVFCPHCGTSDSHDATVVTRLADLIPLELDSYEKMLAESGDSADVCALLMRQAMKKVGVDPDKDEWWVVREQWVAPEGSSTVSDHPKFFRPVVNKLKRFEDHYGLESSIPDGTILWPCPPRFTSVATSGVSGQGRVTKKIVIDRWLSDNYSSLIGCQVIIDDALWRVVDTEESVPMSYPGQRSHLNMVVERLGEQ